MISPAQGLDLPVTRLDGTLARHGRRLPAVRHRLGDLHRADATGTGEDHRPTATDLVDRPACGAQPPDLVTVVTVTARRCAGHDACGELGKVCSDEEAIGAGLAPAIQNRGVLRAGADHDPVAAPLDGAATGRTTGGQRQVTAQLLDEEAGPSCSVPRPCRPASPGPRGGFGHPAGAKESGSSVPRAQKTDRRTILRGWPGKAARPWTSRRLSRIITWPGRHAWA